MFRRDLQLQILRSSTSYRAIGLVGPRQSGKTTLSKICFPNHDYISMENPDNRLRALDDPRSFLAGIKKSVILDEVQNTPEIFSYLQEILDNKLDHRQFILTGSNSFQLNEKISQSLAGRIRMFTVLPLVRSELPKRIAPQTVNEAMHSGLYPRIFDEGLRPKEWFESYYQTYLQKDVKQLIQVQDTNQFDQFVRLIAGRIANLADYSSIATEIGCSQPTATKWASVLEASFITFRLQPHFRNFNKRIIKTPKIFFFDTGLLCQLLRIQSPDQLAIHPLRGSIFENYIVAELMKHQWNLGKQPNLYFWRDQHGHEIDVVFDCGTHLEPVEIKSGATFDTDWLKTLKWFHKLQSQPKGQLIYGGLENFEHGGIGVFSWQNFSNLVTNQQ